MTEKTVIVEISNGVATIALNRPKAMNSLNGQLVEELIETLNEAKNDDTIKVIILTGNGKAFSAGGDLFYIEKLTKTVEKRDFIAKAGAIISTIMTMEKPVIAMVNGVAAGAGFNLALACDMIYSAKSAKFAQSFVKVGLLPDCGGLYLLPRIVGLHKAKELMFTAELIDGEKALQMGIINHLVEDEKLHETTQKFAQKLAESAPVPIGLMKKIINRTYELNLESTLEFEADLQTICMQTEDHQEGVEAFKEKRKPVFKGY